MNINMDTMAMTDEGGMTNMHLRCRVIIYVMD